MKPDVSCWTPPSWRPGRSLASARMNAVQEPRRLSGSRTTSDRGKSAWSWARDAAWPCPPSDMPEGRNGGELGLGAVSKRGLRSDESERLLLLLGGGEEAAAGDSGNETAGSVA